MSALRPADSVRVRIELPWSALPKCFPSLVRNYFKKHFYYKEKLLSLLAITVAQPLTMFCTFFYYLSELLCLTQHACETSEFANMNLIIMYLLC